MKKTLIVALLVAAVAALGTGCATVPQQKECANTATVCFQVAELEFKCVPACEQK